MKKRLLLAVWLLCGLTMLSWGQTDGKKEAKLLVDGCFFTESPSELQGAAYQMSILKNDEGRMMLLVTGIKLSEESKKYAIPLSEVKDADYWLEKAKENKKVPVYHRPRPQVGPEGGRAHQAFQCASHGR